MPKDVKKESEKKSSSPEFNLLIILIALFAVSFIIFLFMAVKPNLNFTGNVSDSGSENGLDSRGCAVSEGFKYSKELGACANVDFTSNQRKAAKSALDYLGRVNGLVVEKVESADCEGCFIVYISKAGEGVRINLENWQVKGVSYIPPEE